MKTFTMELTAPFLDSYDVWTFKLIVPDDVTENNVKEILAKEYNEVEPYEGVKSVVDLLDVVCEKYGWKWEDFEFDIIMDFDNVIK